MVAKGKANAKRKQQKEEKEKERQEQEQKRSKKQEQPEQHEESDDAAADEAGDSEGSGSDGQVEEGESSEGEPGNTDIFEAELKQQEQQLGKHCMVVGTLEEEDDDEEEGESDDEDGKQPSLEALRALARVFVPTQVEEYYTELAAALNEIGGDDDEYDEDEEGMDPKMKAIMAEAGYSFRMLNTKHSYPMHELLKESLAKADKAIKSKQWEEGFCHWAATVQAARREGHWFQDTDVPEVAEGIYEKLRSQWLKLQKHSDEELGGLLCEGAASTKEAFNAFLQALAGDMSNYELKVKDVAKS